MVDFNFDHLQNLAYLDLDTGQKERLKDQVGRILKHVENLTEVDTEGITPTFTIVAQGTPLRQDKPERFTETGALLANGSAVEANAFRVPRIL